MFFACFTINMRVLRSILIAVILFFAYSLPLSASLPDFSTIKNAQDQGPVAQVKRIHSHDGSSLAFRQYIPSEPRAVLLFVHAAGLHSAVGYQHLAYDLAKNYGIAVITPDLRGHGESDGEAGDAPSRKAYFKDLDTLLEYSDYELPDLPLFLGAHGSSASLLLNYQDWHKRRNLSGLILLAPYLGEDTGLNRQNDPAFETRHSLGMITNKSTFGLACGHCSAVNYALPHSAKVSFRPLVDELSVNVARPYTLSEPLYQVRKIRIPFAVWNGSNDELVQGGKTKQFFEDNGREPWMERNELINGESHLSILLNSSRQVGDWMDEVLERPRPKARVQ